SARASSSAGSSSGSAPNSRSRPMNAAGARPRSGDRCSGSPISRSRSASACSSCSISPISSPARPGATGPSAFPTRSNPPWNCAGSTESMDPVTLGILVGVVTTLVLFSGISIGMGLLLVAIGFLYGFSGMRDLSLVPELFFGKLDDFALLSIPMFILMGGAVASSRAGGDLFEALDRWMTRIPGGLVISNLGACALFSALSGSSPATCAAIGKMGIPAMRERGYSDEVASGSIAAGGTLGILIPPSVTMIVYGISTETSIGRLFLAGLVPGLMLTTLFMAWSLFSTWRHDRHSPVRALAARSFSWREKFEILPRV